LEREAIRKVIGVLGIQSKFTAETSES